MVEPGLLLNQKNVMTIAKPKRFETALAGKNKADGPIWDLTETELLALFRGEAVYKPSRPFRIRIKPEMLERLESIMERADA